MIESFDTPAPPSFALIERHRAWGNFYGSILMFLGWDALDSLISYTTTLIHGGKIVRVLLSVMLVLVTLPFVMEKTPWKSRRVTGIASLFAALGVWDLLETLIGLFVKSELEALVFYGCGFILAIAVVCRYEWRYNYDVISNHLINS